MGMGIGTELASTGLPVLSPRLTKTGNRVFVASNPLLFISIRYYPRYILICHSSIKHPCKKYLLINPGVLEHRILKFSFFIHRSILNALSRLVTVASVEFRVGVEPIRSTEGEGVGAAACLTAQ